MSGHDDRCYELDTCYGHDDGPDGSWFCDFGTRHQPETACMCKRLHSAGHDHRDMQFTADFDAGKYDCTQPDVMGDLRAAAEHAFAPPITPVDITKLPPLDRQVEGWGFEEDNVVVDEATGGAKAQKQAQLGAVDPAALLEVAKVAGFGGEKYDRYNFAKGYRWSLSFDAMQRHLLAFWNGENKDPESGLPHLAHAAWHCLALLTFSMRKRGTDDRFPV